MSDPNQHPVITVLESIVMIVKGLMLLAIGIVVVGFVVAFLVAYTKAMH